MTPSSDEKPLILIVDDEKMAARNMAMALAAAGYRTEEADSGQAGLQLALELQPKLIILDYTMPGMDGIAVLQALRKDAWGKDVPVVIASNLYDVDIINTIIGLGVQDYVLKADVNLDEIVKLAGKYVPSPIQLGQQ